MNLSKEQFEACLEILDKVKMLGSIDNMDVELKNDIIQSFISCNNLILYTHNQRPIVRYVDSKNDYYMYCDSFRDVENNIIEELNNKSV